MKENDRKTFAGNRILAWFLIVVLLTGYLPVSVYEVSAQTEVWDGESMEMPRTDTDGTFLITTGAELAWFADQVNKGNGSINGRLKNTIWLNSPDTSYNWIMIGDTEEHPYKGTFDGNNQKIKALYVSISQSTSKFRYAGLFGVIDGGSVSNLSVEGTVVHGYATYGYKGQDDEMYAASGGIAGYLKDGKIANCVNYTETKMDGETKYRNAGGIAGICSGLVIRCTNKGTMSTTVNFAQRYVGGIAGMVTGSGAQILYCDNRQSVQGYYEVGGIAGAVKYGGEIRFCCNYGAVSGNSILGGIAGNVTKTGTYSDGSVKECRIQNVYNLGTIGGTTAKNGTVAGGIIGQMGYEDATDENTPSMPVLEHAYATQQYTNDTNTTRGGVIGYFKSGSIGNVYGMSGSELSPCAAEIKKTTSYIGTVAMKTESELKSVSMIQILGGAFVKTNKYEYENEGFPKLVWQGQTSDLAEKADAGIEELNSWLSEENRRKYGTAYLEIERAVERYKEKLGAVITESDYTNVMEEARTVLLLIKPGTDSDNELAAAIDDGVLALEEYCQELIGQYTYWSEEEILALEEVRNDYISKLEQAETVEQAALFMRDGKDAMDAKAAEHEEEKRLEEVRMRAKYTLTNYRTEETYGQPWDQQIEEIRTKKIEDLDAAKTVSEVRNRLSEAQQAIDDLIDQIPGENVWDGVTLTEPNQSEEGVYQISNGAELAWFANQVNTVIGKNDICGILLNDVSLGNKNWTPIGENTVYTGTFDGNNHRIRGLLITEAETYAGLFGAVYGDENQSIVNLTVSGRIQCKEDIVYAGGIVGYIYGAGQNRRNAVENCHSEVSITVSKVVQTDSAAGGIAGYARNTWFRDCSNEGMVCIDSAGKGGIRYYVGGIIGYTAETVSVRRCCNTGYIWTEFGAGGIVGKVSGSNCELTSNYNCGEIQATTYAGGLVGFLADTADGSQVKWSYNAGPVNLNKSGEFSGALIGSYCSGLLDGVYAQKRQDQLSLTLVGYAYNSTVPGEFVSSEELQRDSMLNCLNAGGNYFIRDYLNLQNGYPILSWQLTLSDFKTGAAAELQTFVQEEEYAQENWILVQEQICSGIKKIQEADSLEAVHAVLTEIKTAIYGIESKADAYEKQLEEAKDIAISEIRTYADLSLYREEEQTDIQLLVSDGIKKISLADTLEQVQEYLLQIKEKIDRLPTIEVYIREQDAAAAAQVDSYISNIGEVVYADYVKMSINIARKAYDMLSETQKILVTLYQVLLDAEAAYALLEEANTPTEEDRLLAAQVDARIAEIGTVTLDSANVIQTARLAYDTLTDLQKMLVVQTDILVKAEAVYDELCGKEVSALIASIGEVTLDKQEIIQFVQAKYDALTEKQKTMVTDHEVLIQAKLHLENLAAADAVIAVIDQIGTVTLERGSVITSVIGAYHALTGAQQSLVTNYSILEQAAVRYDQLQRIAQVETLIRRIGVVSESSGELVQKARRAYEDLEETLQLEVTNRTDLEAAERAYEVLKKKTKEENAKPVGTVADLYLNTKENEKNGSFDKGETVDLGQIEEISINPDGSLQFGEDYVPVWEDDEESGTIGSIQIQTSAGSAGQLDANGTILEVKRKEHIFILSIVFGACTAVTATVGAAVAKAAKKRRKMRVHY